MSLFDCKDDEIYTDDKSKPQILTDYGDHTIRHLTMKQIQNSYAHPYKLLMIDNAPVYRLIVTVKIIEMKRKSNFLVLTIDDYTSIRNYKKIIANQTEHTIMSDIKLIKYVHITILNCTFINTQ